MSEILKKIFSIKNSKSKSGKVLTIFNAQFSIDFSKSCQKIIEKTPVVENRILFANFTNKGFGCSPKYIAQEIIKQNLPYELLWIVKNPRKERKNFPKEIKLIKDTFLNSIKAHASSKIWISNHRKSNLCQKGLIKKSGQIYFQTWHGMMSLKKIEKDAYPENSSSERLAKIDSSNIDYLLSGAQRDNELFKRVFYYDGKIMDFGIPRNDLFFFGEELKNNIKKQVRENLGIPQDKKVLLYAPTFRDNKNLKCYDIDIERILPVLNKKFGSQWICITRLHPNISKYAAKAFKYDKDIINATNYSDMQELILLADILVTDFSSSMFDFSLQNKPVFLYASDYGEYLKTNRELYIKPEELPFAFAKNNDEIISFIEQFNNEEYLLMNENFKKQMGFFDKGIASSKVVEIIKQNIKGD